MELAFYSPLTIPSAKKIYEQTFQKENNHSFLGSKEYGPYLMELAFYSPFLVLRLCVVDLLYQENKEIWKTNSHVLRSFPICTNTLKLAICIKAPSFTILISYSEVIWSISSHLFDI